MDILLDRIKELCKSRSITVTMLESKLSFPKNTIYQWKKRVPGTEKLKAVSDFFGVSIDYLLGRTDTPSPEGEKLSEQEQKLLMRFRRGSQNLSEDEKAIYERQAMNLFDYINKTMHEIGRAHV